MGVLLSFLAKNQTIDTILLVAIAVVGSIRAVSYYKEDLSKDLAKMLPFALLGVFLIDITFFEISNSVNLLKEVPNQLATLAYYLGFIVLLEFILRILYSIVSLFVDIEDPQADGD